MENTAQDRNKILQLIDSTIAKTFIVENEEIKMRSKILKYITGFIGVGALLFLFYKGYTTYDSIKITKNKEYAVKIEALENKLKNEDYKEVRVESKKIIEDLEDTTLFKNDEILSKSKAIKKLAEDRIIEGELEKLNGLKNKFLTIKKYTDTESYDKAEEGLSQLIKDLSGGLTDEYKKLSEEAKTYERSVIYPKKQRTRMLITNINKSIRSIQDILNNDDVYSMIVAHDNCPNLSSKLESRKFKQAPDLSQKILELSDNLKNKISFIANKRFEEYIKEGENIENLFREGESKTAKSSKLKIISSIERETKSGLFNEKYGIDKNEHKEITTLIVTIENNRLEEIITNFKDIQELASDGEYYTASSGLTRLIDELSCGVTNDYKKILTDVTNYKNEFLDPKIAETKTLFDYFNYTFLHYDRVIKGNNVYEMMNLHEKCDREYDKIPNTKMMHDLREKLSNYSNTFQERIGNMANQKFNEYKKQAEFIKDLIKKEKYSEARTMNERLKSDIIKDQESGLFSDRYFKQK